MIQSIEAPAEHAAFLAELERAAGNKNPGEMMRVSAPLPESELRAYLHGVGLHRVRRFEPDHANGDCTHLEAYKPDIAPVAGVIAAMSLPRYGMTSSLSCITKALLPLRIPIIQSWGVYWSEAISKTLADLIQTDCRFIVTVDSDSIFDAADVAYLVKLMERYPEAAAISGVQMRRTKPSALLTMKDLAEKVPLNTFDEELTEIRSSHFGLTAIRADFLRKLSKPWFQAIPDVNGEWWGEGYIAADVAFWLKCEREGLRLFQANYIVVGHVEEMPVWPDRALRPFIQNMDDYRLHGVPDEALR